MIVMRLLPSRAAQYSLLKRAGKKQTREWFKDLAKDENNFVESHPKKN